MPGTDCGLDSGGVVLCLCPAGEACAIETGSPSAPLIFTCSLLRASLAAPLAILAGHAAMQPMQTRRQQPCWSRSWS